MSGNILLTWIALYLITFPLHISPKSLNNEKNNLNLNEIIKETTLGDAKLSKINSNNENKFPKYYCEERHALINKTRLWPNKTVYYKIINQHFDAKQIELIKKAIKDLNKLSCVSLKPVENEHQHYLKIKGNGGWCWAYVGYYKKKQELNMNKDCFSYGTMVHELLHVIGFHHMHLTYDRDDYIEILWDNVAPNGKSSFNKYSPTEVTNLGLPYDYGSVMHYPANAHGINGKTTMVAKLPTNDTMGQRKGLSKLDIVRLNKLYECPGY